MLGIALEKERKNDPNRRGGKLPAEYRGITLVDDKSRSVAILACS
jgi:hypothetical protein